MKLNSETQLVEAAQNGHLESFGALYERYHSPMVALAYSMLADRDLAEDAAQEDPGPRTLGVEGVTVARDAHIEIEL